MFFKRNSLYYYSQRIRKQKSGTLRAASHGESASQAKRALMLPQELKQMPFKEEIILLNGENPIKCEKALYFNDPYFMRKLISLSPTLQ
ncbi:type IV secretory system conjugative DNA transfer family protein, partial [Streptococcus pneumoniae]